MTSGTAPAAPFSMYRVRVQDLVGLTLNWVLLLHHIFLVLFQFCLISLQNRSKSTQGQYLVDLLHSVDELLRYCAMLPTLAMPVLPYFLPHKQNQSKSTQPSLKPTVPPCNGRVVLRTPPLLTFVEHLRADRLALPADAVLVLGRHPELVRRARPQVLHDERQRVPGGGHLAALNLARVAVV